MVWRVEIRQTAERQLGRITPASRLRIIQFLRERIEGCADPRAIGNPLQGEMAGLWRYRVGDYRLICHVQDEKVTVLVLEIGHRREIYR